MKKRIAIIVIFAVVFCALNGSVQTLAQTSDPGEMISLETVLSEVEQLLTQRDYVPGQIIFRTEDNLSEVAQTAIINSIEMVMNMEEIQEYGSFICTPDGSLPYFDLDFENNFFAITVPEALMESILVMLRLNPAITYAAPNYCTKIIDSDVVESIAPDGGPNLSGFDGLTSMYAMNYIGVKEAWDKGFTGISSETPVVRVGVIDTGYTSHVDIDTVFYTYSYNAALDSYDYSSLGDEHGHGTAMIGIMGATLNGVGMNGAIKNTAEFDSNVRIYPIKVVSASARDAEDDCYQIDAAFKRALEHAEEQNLDIVSMSWGMSNNLRDMVEGIYSGLLVVPAGNENSPLEEEPSCRGYMNDDPNWIVVGVSDDEDSIGPWAIGNNGDVWGSNWSKDYVDLFAPGYEIATTHNNGTGYVIVSGSSCSVPFVTAAAVIIMTHATQYRDDPEGLIDLLCSTVDQKSWLSEKCVSGGRLSLINAVEYLYTEPRPRTYPGAHSKGDINGDSYITEDDAILIRAYIMGAQTFSYAQERAADIDGNGSVNSMDYAKVKKFANQTYYFPPSY